MRHNHVCVFWPLLSSSSSSLTMLYLVGSDVHWLIIYWYLQNKEVTTAVIALFTFISQIIICTHYPDSTDACFWSFACSSSSSPTHCNFSGSGRRIWEQIGIGAAVVLGDATICFAIWSRALCNIWFHSTRRLSSQYGCHNICAVPVVCSGCTGYLGNVDSHLIPAVVMPQSRRLSKYCCSIRFDPVK